MKKFFKVKKSLSFDENDDNKTSSSKSKQSKNNSHLIKQSASFHPVQSRPLPQPQIMPPQIHSSNTSIPAGYLPRGVSASQLNPSSYSPAYSGTNYSLQSSHAHSNANIRNSSLDRKVSSVPYPNSFNSDQHPSIKQEKQKAKELFAAVKMRKSKTSSGDQSMNEEALQSFRSNGEVQMKSYTLPGNMKPNPIQSTEEGRDSSSTVRLQDQAPLIHYSGFSNNAFQSDCQSFAKNNEPARSGAGFAIYAHRVQMQQKYYEQQQARIRQANVSNSSLNSCSQRNSPYNFSEVIIPNLPQSQSFPVSMSSEINNLIPSQQNSLTNLPDSSTNLPLKSNQTNSFRSLTRQTTSSSMNYNSDVDCSEYSSHYGIVRRYATDVDDADSEIYRDAESFRGGLRGPRDTTPMGYFSETESSTPDMSNGKSKGNHQSLFYSTRRSNQGLKYMPPLSGYANRNSFAGQPGVSDLTVKLPYSTIPHAIKEDPSSDKPNENNDDNRLNAQINCNGNCRSAKEEEQAQEIRKLRRELEIANQKITTLTSKLSSNDCTISAYEHSFTNMKSRLQSLNASAAEKDNELQSLRSTISSLRREANLPPFSPSPTSSTNLHGRACSVEPSVSTPDLHARSNSMSTSVAATPPMRRAACQKTKQSTDSESVLHSAHSFSSLASNSTSGSPLDNQQNEHTSHTRRGPRKSWLRNSLGRAFRRKSKGSSEMEAMADSISIRQSDSVETECGSERVRPNSTPYSEKLDSSDQSDTALNMETLRRELAEKNMMLTDLQLSALSSAHQVEQMKEQILNLKADKERLEQCLSSALSSRTGSEQTDRSSTAEDDTDFTDSNNPRLLVSPSQANEVILNSKLSPDNDSGIGDQSALSKDEDVIIDPSNEPSPPAKRVVVRIPALSLSQTQSEHSPSVDNKSHTLIGCLSIDPNTTWIELENSVRKLFKTFTHHIDPSTRLGLGNDSIIGLKLGSSQAICRDSISVIKQTPYSFIEDSTQSNSSSGQSPDNQYLTLIMRSTENHSDLANSSNLAACLDALALETLVPRTILQRYIALVLEHKRIILCGPSGTGKTYLANRLADFLVSRSGSQGDISQSMIGRFKVEPKSNKELRAYLSNIADLSMRCSDSRQEEQKCPTVIIVDNLHHVPCLADIFNSFLSSVSPLRCPYIIGTMNQSTFSANNLQLHHNFRWVLCANHMEPVKGFLGRYLRRKLLQTEIVTKKKQEKLGKVVVWISSLWQMLNDFLESHASSDVTIGPRLFLACPMKLEDSQVWFCDLWNYSLVPYLLEALREGIQTFGKRAIWRDPVDWILSTWPWSSSSSVIDEFSSPLIRLRPEDVGYDSQLFGTCSPLLNPPSPLANSSHAAGINKPSSSRTPASYHTTSSKATSFVYPPYLGRNSSSSEMSSNSNNGESYKATLMQMKPLRLMSHEHDVI